MTESLVTVAHSNNSYIDESFYKTALRQDELNKEDASSYPVKVKLVEIGWMLNETDKKKHGLKFLQAIYNSENFDLYDTDTIKIIVEFFYMKYSRKILSFLFPIYVATVIIFLTTLFYFEIAENEKEYAKDNKTKRDKNNKRLILEDDPRL